VVYSIVFGFGIYYLNRLIVRGPTESPLPPSVLPAPAWSVAAGGGKPVTETKS
jgi:hypothetical protein